MGMAFAETIAGTKSSDFNFQVQAWAFKYIFPTVISPSLLTTIEGRLLKQFDIDVIPRDTALNVMSSLPMHCAMCVIKAWLNAWATSYRMHESYKRKCIFGCNAPECKDTLSHYVHCPILLHCIGERTGFQAAHIDARLATLLMSREALLNVLSMFTTYHHVKRGKE